MSAKDERTVGAVRELAENYNPISRLCEVSRMIERNGGVGDEERREMRNVLNDCKIVAEALEVILREA